MDAFYRQATKDGKPVEKDPSVSMSAAFGARPAAAGLDPALRALVGDTLRNRSDKQYSFEERVERVFTKLHHQAVRHKTNFKNTDYDLDTQVT